MRLLLLSVLLVATVPAGWCQYLTNVDALRGLDAVAFEFIDRSRVISGSDEQRMTEYLELELRQSGLRVVPDDPDVPKIYVSVEVETYMVRSAYVVNWILEQPVMIQENGVSVMAATWFRSIWSKDLSTVWQDDAWADIDYLRRDFLADYMTANGR